MYICEPKHQSERRARRERPLQPHCRAASGARSDAAAIGGCAECQLPDNRISGARGLQSQPEAGVWAFGVFWAAGGGDFFEDAVSAAQRTSLWDERKQGCTAAEGRFEGDGMR